MSPELIAALRANAQAPAQSQGRARFVNGQMVLDEDMKTKGRGGTATSLISEGGALGGAAAGAAAGSVVPVIGTAIGGILGAGIGGFSGRLAENKIRDDEFRVGDAGKEGALSAVLAGPLKLAKYGTSAGKGLKAGASLESALVGAADDAAKFSVKGAVGKKAAQAGDDLITKQFRFTPTQLTNYKKKFGEDAAQTIKKYGITSVDDVNTKAIEPLNKQFDEIVASVGSVSNENLRKAFAKKYQPLLKSSVQDNKAIGQQLKKQSDDILKRYGDSIDSKELNALRKEFDSLVSYTDRAANPARYGVNKRSADALRDALQDSAKAQGLPLKEVGKELGKTIKLSEYISRQANLGRGSLPFGLPTMLGGAAGGAAFGPAGIGTAGAVAIGNSSAGRKALQGGTSALGNKLTAGAEKPIRNSLWGAARGQVGEGILNQSSNTSAMTMSPNPNNTAPINANMTQQYTNPVNNASGIDRQQILEAMLIDLQTTGGKNMSKIQALYEFANPESDQQQLSGEAQKRALTSQSGLRSLDVLDQTLQSDPGAFQRQALPNPFGITAGLTGTTDVRAATDNVVDVIARLRSGAAITDSEAARFARFLPQPGDSQESAMRKLAAVRAELESFVNPQSSSMSLEDALLQYNM